MNTHYYIYIALVGLMSLASCAADFDFDEAKRANPEFVYRENFEMEYGKIDPDQSWDFTLQSNNFRTRAGEGNAPLPPIVPTIKVDTYTIPNAISGWIDKNLSSRRNNSGKGVSFVMTVPNNSFDLIPVFCDNSGSADWTFYMVVGDQEIKLWQRVSNNTSLKNFYSYKQDGSKVDAIDNGKAKVTTFYLPDYVGQPIYFKLELDANSYGALGGLLSLNNDYYGKKGDVHSSLDQKMFAVSCDRPSNIDPSKEVKMIACEDATRHSDNDYNDFAFLMVGNPKIPNTLEQESSILSEFREMPTLSKSKRYLVEDLGAVTGSDIDFNDIVVDIKERVSKKYEWTITNTNGQLVISEPVETDEQKVEQIAYIRALGGTKRIALYIGDDLKFVKGSLSGITLNSIYEGVQGTLSLLEPDVMYNTGPKSLNDYYGDKDYLARIDLGENPKNEDGTYKSGFWNPDENNIRVDVYGIKSHKVTSDAIDSETGFLMQATDGTTHITFPKNGTVPAMIAVPVTQAWNWEQVSVFNQEKDESTGRKLRLCNLNHDDDDE